MAVGYLGGGGALLLQTHKHCFGTGWQTSLGKRDVLGQDCTLSMSLGCLQHDVWYSWIVQSETGLQQSLCWLDTSQRLQLVRTSMIAKCDFMADWGHKSTSWVIFLAVKKYFKIDFFFPFLSFSHCTAAQSGVSRPHCTSKPK